MQDSGCSCRRSEGAEIWHRAFSYGPHITVRCPTSQSLREISREMRGTEALGAFGPQAHTHCKLFTGRETKKPVGAPWWTTLCSVSGCRGNLGLGGPRTLKGAGYGSQGRWLMGSSLKPSQEGAGARGCGGSEPSGSL